MTEPKSPTLSSSIETEFFLTEILSGRSDKLWGKYTLLYKYWKRVYNQFKSQITKDESICLLVDILSGEESGKFVYRSNINGRYIKQGLHWSHQKYKERVININKHSVQLTSDQWSQFSTKDIGFTRYDTKELIKAYDNDKKPEFAIFYALYCGYTDEEIQTKWSIPRRTYFRHKKDIKDYVSKQMGWTWD